MESFATSVLRLFERRPRVPDYMTLSRRSHSFARWQPKAIPNGLHLAVDADTGEASCHLTANATDDASHVPVLLELTKGEIASVTADGSYDGELV